VSIPARPLAMILLRGDSKRNAEKVRAWLTGDGSHHRPHMDELIDDWMARGYLLREDAAEIKEGR